MTRRKFIAGAAAATTLGPTMLTGRSWAQATANAQYGVLLIGAGKRATQLVNQFFGESRFRILAVAEVDTNRRNNFVDIVNKKYGNKDCLSVNDYREVLDDKRFDVVLNITPDHWHTLPAMQAAMLGKHIYCEKPLTLNIHESEQIIKAVRKYNVKFQTGSQQRTEFGGRFITACEYVLNGRLGKCELAECGSGDPAVPCDLPTEEMEAGLDWNLWQGQAPERGYNAILSPRGVHTHFPMFRQYEEYAGGILADLGAHMFDIAQWGLGKDRESPVKIIPPDNADAKGGAKMIYADGKTIVDVAKPFQLKFIGERGSITVDRGNISSEPADILKEPLTDKDIRLPRPKNHVVNFADSIGTDTQPVCDVEIGSRSATLCHLANIAYDVREQLTFDPAAWRFTGNEAANKRLRLHEPRRGFELPEVE